MAAEPPPWRVTRGRVIVVLPAFNEAEAIGALLERIDQSLVEAGLPYAVILVDDGSSDATVAVAEGFARYIPLTLHRHARNQGLGATIRDGLRLAAERCEARDVVVAMDADNTHTPGLIRRMVRQIGEGSDVVIASRYRDGSRIKGVPWHRAALSLGARVLFRLLFPISGVRDYTCSFRAYRGAVLKEAFERYGEEFINRDGFESMVDILLKLRDMDLIFSEVPLILRYDLKGNLSKMRVGRTIRRTLLLLAQRRFGG